MATLCLFRPREWYLHVHSLQFLEKGRLPLTVSGLGPKVDPRDRRAREDRVEKLGASPCLGRAGDITLGRLQAYRFTLTDLI